MYQYIKRTRKRYDIRLWQSCGSRGFKMRIGHPYPHVRSKRQLKWGDFNKKPKGPQSLSWVRGVPGVFMMWTPKRAGGLGAALRPPMGPGLRPGMDPGGEAPWSWRILGNFDANFRPSRALFIRIFLIILCYAVVVFVVYLSSFLNLKTRCKGIWCCMI